MFQQKKLFCSSNTNQFFFSFTLSIYIQLRKTRQIIEHLYSANSGKYLENLIHHLYLDKVICHISYGHTNLIHIQLKIHMPMQHSALQQDILPNGSYAISIFFIKLFAILSMVTLISFIHIQQRHISMQYSDTNNIRCIGQYCVMHICCDTFPMCGSN